MNEENLELALWKLSVLGPLISARLEHGDRQAWFAEAAERVHRRPDGQLVRLSARTIEAWFYLYRQGGLKALGRRQRSDRGQPRAIEPKVADLVLRARREKPRRSIRRIIRMLERARVVRPGELSRSAVHRLLAAHGISGRPRRGPSAERRSFLVEHAGDLWMGDAMHGPRVIAPDGKIRKSYLIGQLDVATRYLPHSAFFLAEGAAQHEYGFKQALLKGGRPRTYYVDLGSAYIARSLRAICGELAIHLVHTAPRDCEAKGAIERFHKTWREEIGDELPDHPLTLAELNALLNARCYEVVVANVHIVTKTDRLFAFKGVLVYAAELDRRNVLESMNLPMLWDVTDPVHSRRFVRRVGRPLVLCCWPAHDLSPLPGRFSPPLRRLFGDLLFFVGCFLRRVSSILADVHCGGKHQGT